MYFLLTQNRQQSDSTFKYVLKCMVSCFIVAFGKVKTTFPIAVCYELTNKYFGNLHNAVKRRKLLMKFKTFLKSLMDILTS